jgi:hypothetical protein
MRYCPRCRRVFRAWSPNAICSRCQKEEGPNRSTLVELIRERREARREGG